MSVELKVKSKHLSEEARIIRFEENKFLKQWKWKWECAQYKNTSNNAPLNSSGSDSYKTYESLNRHRRWDVRNENRATFLARAYMAGIPYSQVEQKRKPENEYTFVQYILPRIVSMVAKYGDKRIQKNTMVGSWANRQTIKNPEYIALEEQIKEWSGLDKDYRKRQ